jgi:hypothetical protein
MEAKPDLDEEGTRSIEPERPHRLDLILSSSSEAAAIRGKAAPTIRHPVRLPLPHRHRVGLRLHEPFIGRSSTPSCFRPFARWVFPFPLVSSSFLSLSFLSRPIRLFGMLCMISDRILDNGKGKPRKGRKRRRKGKELRRYVLLQRRNVSTSKQTSSRRTKRDDLLEREELAGCSRC